MKVSIGEIWHFEDRRFEGTVIFDDRIKPNFVKVFFFFKNLARRSPMFGERRFGASEAYSTSTRFFTIFHNPLFT